jgi:hypothetical protein
VVARVNARVLAVVFAVFGVAALVFVVRAAIFFARFMAGFAFARRAPFVAMSYAPSEEEDDANAVPQISLNQGRPASHVLCQAVGHAGRSAEPVDAPHHRCKIASEAAPSAVQDCSVE